MSEIEKYWRRIPEIIQKSTSAEFFDENLKQRQNLVYGKNIVYDVENHIFGVFWVTKSGEIRPYEKDYDKLKDYKGEIFINNYGARSLKPVLGRNYVFENGKLIDDFIAD